MVISKIFAPGVLVYPLVLGSALLLSSAADAAELTQQTSEAEVNAGFIQEVLQYSSEGSGSRGEDTSVGFGQLDNQPDGQAQVTSISQLSDVRPTDWAFQALQSLVERYGVIAGYPDGTYRGNRALTRYEFAAGLNAALDRVNELLAAGLADKVSREDLATLQRLREEFAAELATLRGQVDSLEARTAQLEANQFSTTTKLNGEVIFAGAGFTGGSDDLVNGRGVDRSGSQTEGSNIIFPYRVRLNFDTSFTGTDRLRTRLQAGNVPSFGGSTLTGTNQARLGFDTNTSNNVELSDLIYQFTVFGTYLDSRGSARPRARVFIGAQDFQQDNVFDVVTPYAGSGVGSISRFGIRNPLYRLGDTNAGFGFDFNINSAINLAAFYGANNQADADPSDVGGDGGGLFGGTTVFGAQLTFRPFSTLTVGLNYYNAYLEAGNLGTGTASLLAENIGNGLPTNVDAYGAQFAWRIAPKISISGFAGYITANQRDFGGNDGGSAQALTYLGYLGFSDVLGEGNSLVLAFGQPLRLTDEKDIGLVGQGAEEDTTYHAEAFFRLRLTNNILITPGIIYLINPENNSNNDNIFIGTIRTTFTF